MKSITIFQPETLTELDVVVKTAPHTNNLQDYIEQCKEDGIQLSLLEKVYGFTQNNNTFSEVCVYDSIAEAADDMKIDLKIF